jgi:radical SAM protein with 4Fe4S-binding SPASM domain
LLTVPWGRFDGVSWQLNALFNSPGYRWSSFPKWAEAYYKPSVARLCATWEASIRKDKLLPIIPFNDIMISILTQIPAKLRCGAGWRDFAITTNGDVLPCPIAGMETMKLCNISHPGAGIENRWQIEGPCAHCPIRDLCGGRCLFANYYNEWGRDGFDFVCGCTRFLIDNLKQRESLCRLRCTENINLWQQLSRRQHHGCEVIP